MTAALQMQKPQNRNKGILYPTGTGDLVLRVSLPLKLAGWLWQQLILSVLLAETRMGVDRKVLHKLWLPSDWLTAVLGLRREQRWMQVFSWGQRTETQPSTWHRWRTPQTPTWLSARLSGLHSNPPEPIRETPWNKSNIGWEGPYRDI